jgi:hypothetical protein
MYISLQRQHVSVPWLLRWYARASGLILMVAWLALVIAEATRPDVGPPTLVEYCQGAALVLVFAGYLLAWRKELLGAFLTILGAASFFVIPAVMIDYTPEASAAWFAAPAVLHLLAWQCDRKPQVGPGNEP